MEEMDINYENILLDVILEQMTLKYMSRCIQGCIRYKGVHVYVAISTKNEINYSSDITKEDKSEIAFKLKEEIKKLIFERKKIQALEEIKQKQRENQIKAERESAQKIAEESKQKTIMKLEHDTYLRDREINILKLCKNKTNRELALELRIGSGYIGTIRKNALKKLKIALDVAGKHKFYEFMKRNNIEYLCNEEFCLNEAE